MTTVLTPTPAAAHRRGDETERWWVRHRGRLEDLGLTALLVVGAGAIVVLDRASGLTWVTWTRVALTLAVAAGLLLGRRRHPLALAWAGVLTVALGASELALPAVLGPLAVRLRGRLVTVVASAGAVAYVFARWYDPATADRTAALLIALPNALLLAGLPVAVGAYLRTRRDLMRELQDRAERAEADEVARAEQARLSERTRIAREMHDVLAHRVSLVALHAAALEMNPDRDGREIERSAALIRTTAREALEDLRGVLGVLRSDGPNQEAGLQPQPSLAGIERLATTSAQAGVQVHLEHAVASSDDLPLLIGRTAYRVVQEGLTNVHKHAPGATATVRLTGAPGGVLAVEVVSGSGGRRPGATPVTSGAGLGLIGLRERVELAGGSFVAGPGSDGSFRVRAELPWPISAASS